MSDSKLLGTRTTASASAISIRPSAAAPAVGRSFGVARRVADAPLADAPLADAPLADAPLADAPLADAPLADAPLAEARLADVVARRGRRSAFAPFALDASAAGSTTIGRKPPFAVSAAGWRSRLAAAVGSPAAVVAGPQARPACSGRVRRASSDSRPLSAAAGLVDVARSASRRRSSARQ